MEAPDAGNSAVTDLQAAHDELLARGVKWIQACSIVGERYGLSQQDVAHALQRAESEDRRRPPLRCAVCGATRGVVDVTPDELRPGVASWLIQLCPVHFARYRAKTLARAA